MGHASFQTAPFAIHRATRTDEEVAGCARNSARSRGALSHHPGSRRRAPGSDHCGRSGSESSDGDSVAGSVRRTGPGKFMENRAGPGSQTNLWRRQGASRDCCPTLQTKPQGVTHWSCRLMAQQQGLSKSTVSNLWRSHNLKPHRVKRFKLSRDPQFLEKLTDVVGLYLNPPQQALVLCVDEKSQIQALNRAEPGLPLKQGRCGIMARDYKRHGTATLFAAQELAQGKVGGQCQQRH